MQRGRRFDGSHDEIRWNNGRSRRIFTCTASKTTKGDLRVFFAPLNWKLKVEINFAAEPTDDPAPEPYDSDLTDASDSEKSSESESE